MKLLLIDTCGSTGSVAFADSTLVPPILAAITLPGRTASERLVATIRDLAATHNLPLHSLDAVAVVAPVTVKVSPFSAPVTAPLKVGFAAP